MSHSTNAAKRHSLPAKSCSQCGYKHKLTQDTSDMNYYCSRCWAAFDKASAEKTTKAPPTAEIETPPPATKTGPTTPETAAKIPPKKASKKPAGSIVQFDSFPFDIIDLLLMYASKGGIKTAFGIAKCCTRWFSRFEQSEPLMVQLSKSAAFDPIQQPRINPFLCCGNAIAKRFQFTTKSESIADDHLVALIDSIEKAKTTTDHSNFLDLTLDSLCLGKANKLSDSGLVQFSAKCHQGLSRIHFAHNAKISDAGFAAVVLTNNQSLKSVTLSSQNKISMTSFAALGACTKLECLNITALKNVSMPVFVKYLSAIPTLKCLSMMGCACWITTNNFSEFGKLLHIEILKLEVNSVNDSGIEQLLTVSRKAGAKSLRVLSLKTTSPLITEAIEKKLAEHPSFHCLVVNDAVYWTADPNHPSSPILG